MTKRIAGFFMISVFFMAFISCKKDNQVPVLTVNAGNDITIQLPLDSVLLNGLASYNLGDVSTYTWSQLAGPVQALIVSSAKAETRIRGFKAGDYSFQLKCAISSGMSMSDTIFIKVLAQPAPKVNAGADRTISFPADSVILNGSATGGSPGVTIASYAWTQISGPSAATFGTATTAGTSVSDLQIGSYLFQLKATDNFGTSAMDTVAVVVNNKQFTLSLQPGSNPNEYYLNTNGSFGGAAILCAENWTVGGGTMNLRALFKFDLSSMVANPSRIKIVSAKLSLYSHPNPTDGNLVDANFGTNNTLLIQRVTAPWTKTGLTWANQPAVTTTDQLVVPHTNSSKLDLIDQDVTAMVQAMMANGNNGFLLRLQNETILYNSRLFCSSLYTDATKRPAITIVYEGK